MVRPIAQVGNCSVGEKVLYYVANYNHEKDIKMKKLMAIVVAFVSMPTLHATAGSLILPETTHYLSFTPLQDGTVSFANEVSGGPWIGKKTVGTSFTSVTAGLSGTTLLAGRADTEGAANAGAAYISSAGAMYLNDTSSHVMGGDFTLEFMVKADEPQCNRYIVRHETGMLQLRTDSWGSPLLTVNGQSATEWPLSASKTLPSHGAPWGDGCWHHVAIVQDRTAGTCTLYTDYQKVATVNAVVPAESAAGVLYVGAYQTTYDDSVKSSWTKTTIDELRLTAKVLKPSEFIVPRAYAENGVSPMVDKDTFAYIGFNGDLGSANDLVRDNPDVDHAVVVPAAYGNVHLTGASEGLADRLYAGGYATSAYVDGNKSLSVPATAASMWGMIMDDTASTKRYTDDSFTVELVFKATASTSTESYLIDHEGVFRLYFNKTTQALSVQAWKEGSCTSVCSSSAALADGNWHHLALVWDKTAERLMVYIDRKSVGLQTGVSSYSPTGVFMIGWNCWLVADRKLYSGAIDEFRVTSRALKPQEFLAAKTYAIEEKTRLYLDFEDGFDGPYSLPLVAEFRNYTGKSVSTDESIPAAQIYDGALEGSSCANGKAVHVLANKDGSGNLTKGNCIRVKDMSPSMMSDDFTAEMFFRLTAEGNPSTTYLINMLDVLNVQYGSSNGGYLRLSCNGAQVGDLVTSPLDGAWHHLAVTFDKANGAVAWYIDGALVSRGINEAYKSLALRVTDDYPIQFGSWGMSDTQYTAYNYFGDVWWDEIRITQRLLKPTEFLSTAHLSVDHLAWATFDNTSAVTPVNVYTGNGAEGRTAGTVAYATSRPGKSILDAEGDVIRAENVRALSMASGTMTLAENALLDTDSFTGEFFLKAVSGSGTVLARAIYGNADNAAWKITYSDGVLAFVLGNQSVSFGNLPTDRPWHHVAFSCDAVEDGIAVKLWLDYQVVAEETVAGDLKATWPSKLIVGGSGLTAGVDELRFRAGVCDVSTFLHVPPRPGLFIFFE